MHRKMMVRNGKIVSIPVSDRAQEVLSEFFADHLPELTERLAGVGADPNHMAIPRFREVVYDREDDQ